MIIENNTTIVDVAFNLSGSLAGIPVILSQIVESPRVGFDDIPKPWEDSTRQTWTPDLRGMDASFDVPVYSVPAVSKQPYSTDLFALEPVITYGDAKLFELKHLLK